MIGVELGGLGEGWGGWMKLFGGLDLSWVCMVGLGVVGIGVLYKCLGVLLSIVV